MNRENYYLGTANPSWLGRAEMPPLFVSVRRLRQYVSWPAAVVPWAMDSGAFTEVSTHGRFTTSPEEYVDEVLRASEEIGGMRWAAQQDFMCEPHVLAVTGLRVRDHQRKTVENFLTLRGALGDLVIPTLQGWTVADYFIHARMFRDAGVDLAAESIVGVGSVCRRTTASAAEILGLLSIETGARLHGFGCKITNLKIVADLAYSADSMAWSYRARKKNIKLEECLHSRCQHCPIYARKWWDQTVSVLGLS